MSNLVITAAPINNDEDLNNNKIKPKNKTQTYKNKDSVKINKNILESMYNDSDSESELADYKPVQSNMHYNTYTQPEPEFKKNLNKNDTPVQQGEYQNLESNFNNDYYQEHINNYKNTYSYPQQVNPMPNNELLKKLDNILHLLEEQKEEQTHLITEELILYIFLGIFIIYVLDSFVRAGKYVR